MDLKDSEWVVKMNISGKLEERNQEKENGRHPTDLGQDFIKRYEVDYSDLFRYSHGQG